MTWFKVDDKFHSHAKVARLGDHHDGEFCVAADQRLPGRWVVGLSGDDEETVVWLAHPLHLIDEGGALTPQQAIAIGEALLRLGRAALAQTN